LALSDLCDEVRWLLLEVLAFRASEQTPFPSAAYEWPVGQRAPLAILMNERLLVAAARSKAASPLPANPGHLAVLGRASEKGRILPFVDDAPIGWVGWKRDIPDVAGPSCPRLKAANHRLKP
jgi:hypothetical protein